MATVTIDSRNGGVSQRADFHFTSDNAAQSVNLGFVPSRVLIVNETDSIVWEKIGSMTAANSLKNTAGAAGACVIALDTNSQILINTDGTITLGATLVGNAKAIKGYAMS
jgi:hypothetical protein